MAKDISKLKEDFRAELFKIKEELRQELKTSKESVDRRLTTEIRGICNEQKDLESSMTFSQNAIEELKRKLDAEISKNNHQQKKKRAAASEMPDS